MQICPVQSCSRTGASSFARLGTFFEVGTRIHCVSNAVISHVNVNTVCTTPLTFAQLLMLFLKKNWAPVLRLFTSVQLGSPEPKHAGGSHRFGWAQMCSDMTHTVWFRHLHRTSREREETFSSDRERWLCCALLTAPY